MMPVVISRTEKTAIDFMAPDGMTAYGRKPIEVVRQEYPDAETLSVQDARQVLDDLHRLPVTPISKEGFYEYLECLPPEDWERRGETESFKMSEYYSGNVTTILARIGNRYFQMRDRASLSHEEIIEQCRKAL